jgi:RNA polymerase sigma-70 factor (ECF subfamily)
MTVEEAQRSDEQLIAAISAGRMEAFEALYARYGQRAYRIALSICQDIGDAQEAVQDAFLAVWQTGSSFSQQRGSPAAWLLSIVRHRSIDITRRDGRHATRRASADTLETMAAIAETSDVALRNESERELRDSLARLPPAQQEVISLAFFGQLSHSEVARALDLPAGTVKGRMRLGMNKLRSTVERPAP